MPFCLVFCLALASNLVRCIRQIGSIKSADTAGALILGKGFLTVDITRYSAGILIAAAFDKMIFKLAFRNE